MVRHIVMWKFNPGCEKEMEEFFAGLRSLPAQMDIIKRLEIGVSINEKNNYDAVLITEFETMEDLNSYKNDPRHLKVSALCKAIRSARADVDYEF